jgi:hypothetical protein
MLIKGSFKMDISQDQKKQKRKSELGSEKRSRDSFALKGDKGVILIDDKPYQMPPDLRELKEVNYDDPEIKKRLVELETESLKKYGKLTPEELEYMAARRLELEKEMPDLSAETLNQLALKELRKGC